MDTFVDWITDAGNYDRTKHKFVHSHDDIADYINSIHRTKWDRTAVRNATQFVKRRYYRAKEILISTGKGKNTDTALPEQVLTLCPPFEKLDTVFGTPFAGLHIPPVQTLPPHPGELSNSRALLTPVDLDDISDTDPDDHPTEDEITSHSLRRSKRRETEKSAVATSSKGAVVNKRASKEEVAMKLSFDTEGMDTLVNWITDARNYEQTTHRRTIFSQKKLVHSHDDIANYINSIHGTNWDRHMVSYRLRWLKMTHGHAKEMLASAGEERNTETEAILRDNVLTMCPPFEKLDTVFGSPPERPHLPPVQTLPPRPKEPSSSRAPLSPDMTDLDDISDTDYDDQSTEDEAASHSLRRSKRRETEETAVATSSEDAMTIKQASKEIDSRRRSFNTEGMDTLVDWITDARNYKPSTSKRTTGQKKLVHSHDDIVNHINSTHGTKWNRGTIEHNLEFVIKRYYQAKELLISASEGGSIETDTTLRDEVLTVCPPFEKLDTVFGAPGERLHLPPVQTLPPHPGEPAKSLSPDMTDIDDIDDMDYNDQPTE
ncbi:hypothetical protein BGX31_003602, partial [Mortierella sp. GBA43]